MKVLFDLFRAFFTIGALTFGGGYAMLPMLEREIVTKHSWATNEELLNYFAIGQCTPGIIAVNTATFVGYKVKGVIGGIVATLGVVAPSMVIITIIAMVLENFMDIGWV
ncbi:MAG: chromate transporter [Clostridia bacterium]|nr:chromate transporter [Clostridia bacterium]